VGLLVCSSRSRAIAFAMTSTTSVTILLGWRLVVQQVTNYLREDLELSLYF